ncbi:MAG: hypothetical protein HC808_07465 [Candidatus Competibacteraceae bacterium]|nr:hypothetical protein [Candidatus Competibacteraceae bacterium]
MTAHRVDPALAAGLLKMRLAIRKEFGAMLDIYAPDAIPRFIAYGLKSQDNVLRDFADALRAQFPEVSVIEDEPAPSSAPQSPSAARRSYRGVALAAAPAPTSPDKLAIPVGGNSATTSPGRKPVFYRGVRVK